MIYEWHNLLGNIGVFTIVVAYLLLQTKRLLSTSISYSLLNAVGAGLVLISLTFEFNASAFILEVFWILISIFGIVTSYRSRAGEIDTPGHRP